MGRGNNMNPTWQQTEKMLYDMQMDYDYKNQWRNDGEYQEYMEYAEKERQIEKGLKELGNRLDKFLEEELFE